ncbi:MAG: hypothetical protein R3C03_17150 [Pirellulaceae bacterium]
MGLRIPIESEQTAQQALKIVSILAFADLFPQQLMYFTRGEGHIRGYFGTYPQLDH